MIEIVFSDSACGSLKMAQRCGDGEYSGGCIGVIITHADGSKPSRKEIEEAQVKAEKENRLAWEKAISLGGDPADVYGFSLSLSMGDISESEPGPQRQKALEHLYSIYPNDDGQQAAREMLQQANDNLKILRDRALTGEPMRIWYSNHPDELCGLFWFLTQIHQFGYVKNQISLIRLPDWETDADGQTVWRAGWGEIAVGEWHLYTSLEQKMPPSFCDSCAAQWRLLQLENAPLRAVLNGQLVSVPETIYDEFIVREIEKEDTVFNEAMIIGRVLGSYRLGIGDAWIAHRIEAMIHAGTFEAVTVADKDMPIYHRKLKKILLPEATL